MHQLPNNAGKSRQGLPVRAIHNTASKSRRLFLPLRPGSVGLPRQCGSIFAHWASVSTKRSIQSVNHIFGKMKILNPYTSIFPHLLPMGKGTLKPSNCMDPYGLARSIIHHIIRFPTNFP